MREHKKIKDFFDMLSEKWDSMQRNDEKSIEKIFSILNLKQNLKILDVGCGTGVLFDYYLKFHPQKVVGVDISEKMVEKAKLKYQHIDKIKILNKDIFDLEDKDFDLVMLYNCYPHIIEKEDFVKKCLDFVNEKSFVVIAHGSGREEINAIHTGHDKEISTGLDSPSNEVKIWEKYFKSKKLIDEADFYLIVLQLK